MAQVMDEPVANDRLSSFNAALAGSGHGVLLFDYDGTLAPFALDTNAVRPYPGIAAALDAIMDTARARVLIVTGRYLKATPPALDTRNRPEIWGSHGRERLQPDGRYDVAPIDEFALRGLAIADAWKADVEAAGGRAEAKPGAIAFHWRGTGAAQMARIRDLVTAGFHAEALEGVLELRHFDGGLELRAPGLDKGDVVRSVLTETAPEVPVAYLGDDLTDEDAFKALRGRGLSVLVRGECRQTAADLWVRPPQALLELLGLWRDALAEAL